MSSRLRNAAACLALMLLAAACGGSRADTGLPASPTPEPTFGSQVQVKDNVFEPKEITVRAGQNLTWIFEGSSQPHNVQAEDGSFNSHPGCASGSLNRCSTGASDPFVRAFSNPGTVAYYCVIHGFPGGIGMAGTVTVQAA